ncbi:hypothetical protein JKP88DRAFT_267006, partial [Tribonema minus]
MASLQAAQVLADLTSAGDGVTHHALVDTVLHRCGPHLRGIQVKSTKVTDAAIQEVIQSIGSRLTVLHLGGCSSVHHPDTLSAIATHCVNGTLTSLDISGCGQVSPNLTEFTTIRSHLPAVARNAFFVHAFLDTHIEHLELVIGSTKPVDLLSGASMCHLHRRITDALFVAWPTLTDLNISVCTGVSDSGLNAISCLPLTSLAAHAVSVTDAGVRALLRHSMPLQMCNLSLTAITIRSVRSIAALETVRCANVRCCAGLVGCSAQAIAALHTTIQKRGGRGIIGSEALPHNQMDTHGSYGGADGTVAGGNALASGSSSQLVTRGNFKFDWNA